MQKESIIALGYRRVSGAKQVKEGDGLGSQEARIREFAERRGYPPLSAMFTDDESGGSENRPGFREMLAFLKKNRAHTCVVIIDDITRLARGVTVHHKLRAAIAATGARLECPSFEFGESSDEQLVENLLASVSQHHRQKNGEQVYNRMRGRLLNGYWCFHAPPGYTHARVSGQTILVKKEPVASIVEEALEGYANGRLQSQAEVQRFLEACPDFPRYSGRVKFDRVTTMLKCVLYSGYLEYPKWDVSLRKAHHEPLISFETYQRIQSRLNGAAKTPARADISEHFPLRGFIRCAKCGKSISGSFSRGRPKEYPYYFCIGKGCQIYRKSLSKQAVETRFDDLLRSLEPTSDLIELAETTFRDIWQQRAASSKERKAALQRVLGNIERSINQIIDRIAATSDQGLIAVYEKRLSELQRDKVAQAEKAETAANSLPDFDDTLRTALQFLSSPWKLWDTGRLEDRRAVLKLVFSKHLHYDEDEGFRTAETTLPFKVLATLRDEVGNLVPLAGIEPALLAELDFE
ncbi:recombinase family protein, partial [Mesorhizobium sp.]|uniref:recombinase family protein n=1 Tax=Mesorhizobium sp. TaxID=1871066 RepID=UPI000FE97C79